MQQKLSQADLWETKYQPVFAAGGNAAMLGKAEQPKGRFDDGRQ